VILVLAVFKATLYKKLTQNELFQSKNYSWIRARQVPIVEEEMLKDLSPKIPKSLDKVQLTKEFHYFPQLRNVKSATNQLLSIFIMELSRGKAQGFYLGYPVFMRVQTDLLI